MKTKSFLYLFLILLISCSVNDSDSYQGIISGVVLESENRPLENVDIGVIYRFINMEPEESGNLIYVYPNPFNSSTTIQFSLENNQDYVLSATKSGTSEETTIFNESLEAGVYSFSWNPSNEGIENGFYRLKDNLGNESIITFFAPTIPIPNDIGTETSTASGGTIGEFLIKTDSNGRFQFSKDQIISDTDIFTRVDETGLEIGAARLRGEIYVVAYLNSDNVAIELIDYTKNQDFNLEFKF